MRQGAWHQMGDRSQNMVREHLDNLAGVGVIISPRDLAKHKAVEFAREYREREVDVVYDPQFHVPDFANQKLQTYPTHAYRNSVSTLHQISDADLAGLAGYLQTENAELQTTAVIAPAVVYEAQQENVVTLNARLFQAAKSVGDQLGVPTYATVVVGNSAVSASVPIEWILSHATGLNADGWYFGFEFEACRLPTNPSVVQRCLTAGLALACTGKPVLHAYAGPLGVLSPGFGATGVAVGHSQNLWRFCRSRWEAPTDGGGGGGAAPPRFFSRALWGTIIYPDEVQQLAPQLRQQVLTHSPYSVAIAGSPPGDWSRWDANKHLTYVICQAIGDVFTPATARGRAAAGSAILQTAIGLHASIRQSQIALGDGTDTYQQHWLTAVTDFQTACAGQIDYLELLRLG